MRISDLRGVLRLAVQATAGVTRITEGVHQSVWATLGRKGGNREGSTRGLTGAIYRLIEDITQITGKSADVVLAMLESGLEADRDIEPRSERAEVLLSVLNGVMGDRLAADKSPFAITMDIRHRRIATNSGHPQKRPHDLANSGHPQIPNSGHPQILPHKLTGVGGKLVLLIHGLCLPDLDQHANHNLYANEPGALLAARSNYYPLYLRYNSGLHISQNGQQLSVQLQRLIESWPDAVDELSVVAHSMGGLVMRSALQQAQQQGLTWPEHLKNIVFLGTPHHGAPLERAGNGLDLILEQTPFAKRFAPLGQLRSAGITDLRFGNLLQQDWDGRGRFEFKSDDRHIVPLPATVRCFTVAATLAGKRNLLTDRLLGDGLVPLRSALGLHDQAERKLEFPAQAQHIAYNTGHLELLQKAEVMQQVLKWLS